MCPMGGHHFLTNIFKSLIFYSTQKRCPGVRDDMVKSTGSTLPWGDTILEKGTKGNMCLHYTTEREVQPKEGAEHSVSREI